MSLNIIIYKNNEKITNENFAITFDDTWSRTAHFGSGKYIYCIEDIRKIIERKTNVIITCFHNPHTHETTNLDDYNTIFQIMENKRINEKYGVVNYEMKFKNIFTNEEKICDVKFSKKRSTYGAGMCPRYTYIMCGSFPVMRMMSEQVEKTYDFCYENDILTLITEDEIREIDILNLDENIKKILNSNDKMTTISYYANRLWHSEKVMEVISSLQSSP